MDEPEYEYDVALSFAGENRPYVELIAQRLVDAGVRVFYADFEQGRLWGEDLVVFFDDVFRKRARFAVMFISQAYVSKHWTTHEARSALARALEQDAPYLLPVRLDDSELPGLRPTVGYIDARDTGRDKLIEMLHAKVAINLPTDRVPRTTTDEARVLESKPPSWEHLLYAGVLLRRKAALEPKWRDHQIRYRASSGLALDEDAARDALGDLLEQIQGIVDNINRILTGESADRAFGLPGEDGDPDQIDHLANRLMDVYEGLLDWAAGIRSMTVPDNFREAFTALAAFADGPIEQTRAFVDEVVDQIDAVPARLEAGERVELKLTLTINILDGQMEAFNAAMGRLRQSYGLDPDPDL